MKSIIKTLSFALAAIMLCSAALLGGTYALAAADNASKPYERDSINTSVNPGNASESPASGTVYVSNVKDDSKLSSWISNAYIAAEEAAGAVISAYDALSLETIVSGNQDELGEIVRYHNENAVKFMFGRTVGGVYEAVVFSVSDDCIAHVTKLDKDYTQLSAGYFRVTSADFDYSVFGNAYDTRVKNLDDTSDAPVAQSEMKKKFYVYNITETAADDPLPGEERQTKLTYFTQAQAESLRARKEGGERFTLSYDEILFIISDSIQAYFNNTHIVLTKATSYGLIYKTRIQRSVDHHITCYHGDFSELEYYSAIHKYNWMIADIYDIIIYRIAMLDTEFLSGDLSVTENGEPYLSDTVGHYKKSFDTGVKDDYRAFLASELYNCLKIEAALVSGTYRPDDPVIELKAPMLFADYSENSGKMIYTVDVSCRTQTTLFPTAELLDMRPLIGDTKPQSSRAFFEIVAQDIYPEYNINMSAPYIATDDLLKVINDERLKGMTFRELVDTFGLPYDGFTSGFCTGCYYTSDGEIIVIYFDGDFNVDTYYLY